MRQISYSGRRYGMLGIKKEDTEIVCHFSTEQKGFGSRNDVVIHNQITVRLTRNFVKISPRLLLYKVACDTHTHVNGTVRIRPESQTSLSRQRERKAD